jgi:hypothetical protein
MKTTLALAGATGLGLVLAAGLAMTPATSQGPPPHNHMLIQGFNEDPETGEFTIRRCVDLANARAVPLHAHHANLHVGKAGEGQERAGNLVVPGTPLTPWANCQELLEFFGLG